jgi:hypothetical protein
VVAVVPATDHVRRHRHPRDVAGPLPGRLASAWAAYLVAENAARSAGQADRARAAADRARAAADRAAALKPRLSTLVIAVPEALRGVAGLEVKRDGAVVTQAQWGVAVPVDANNVYWGNQGDGTLMKLPR